MKANYLKKFIGVERWDSLYQSYKSNSSQNLISKLNTPIIVFAILFSLIPVFSSVYLNPVAATMVFGSVCALSIIIRNRLDFPKITFYKKLKADLSLTHTAFAFGCIPAAFLLILSPETITEHTEIISQSLKSNKDLGLKPSPLEIGVYIVFISLWVAVLEEVVYRGLLLSALRRWKALGNNPYRDHIAVFISAVIFGFAHFHSWGLFASLSLVGLGIGFGIAYICTKEKLLPLIIYHFLFDLISFSIVALN